MKMKRGTGRGGAMEADDDLLVSTRGGAGDLPPVVVHQQAL